MDIQIFLDFWHHIRVLHHIFKRFDDEEGLEGEKNYSTTDNSSLRNVIERCFGVLKARFPILKFMRSYSFKKQIVMACCTIHNFIRLHATRDELFDQFQDSDAEYATVEPFIATKYINNSSQIREMAEKRDSIANHI
ncbi:hypothetical protein LINPERHAP2_LOCUS19299 [Linum perenne]